MSRATRVVVARAMCRDAARMDLCGGLSVVLPMIREAIEKRDDLALGYRSPGGYVSDRFGQSLAGLGIEVRREVVRELTTAGMSTRAIAPVVGGSDRQVRYDVEASGGKDFPPAPLDVLPLILSAGYHARYHGERGGVRQRVWPAAMRACQGGSKVPPRAVWSESS